MQLARAGQFLPFQPVDLVFIFLSDLTIDIRTEVGVGTCMQYLGPSCREFIQGRNIFMKPGYNQDSLERKLSMLFTGEWYFKAIHF